MKSIVVSSLLFIVSGIFLYSTIARRGMADDLVPSTNFVSLSEVAPNSVHHLKLKLANKGRNDIEIVSTRRSCDCTSISVENTKLPPGGSSEIMFEITVPAKPGRFESTVELFWKHSGKPAVYKQRFAIDGTSQSVLVPESLALDFGSIKMRAAFEQKPFLLRRGQTERKWTFVRALVAPPFTADISESKPSEFYVLNVGLHEDAFNHYGNFTRRVSIEISEDEKNWEEVLSLPVSVNLQGPINISPSSIYLGVIESDRIVRAKFTVTPGPAMLHSTPELDNATDKFLSLDEDRDTPGDYYIVLDTSELEKGPLKKLVSLKFRDLSGIYELPIIAFIK